MLTSVGEGGGGSSVWGRLGKSGREGGSNHRVEQVVD